MWKKVLRQTIAGNEIDKLQTGCDEWEMDTLLCAVDDFDEFLL